MQISSLIKFPYFFVSVLVFWQPDFFLNFFPTKWNVYAAHVTMQWAHMTIYISVSDLQHWIRIMFIIYMFLHAKRTALGMHCEAIAHCEQVAIWKLSFSYRLFFCSPNVRCICWNGTIFSIGIFLQNLFAVPILSLKFNGKKTSKNSNKIYWNRKILEIIGSDESWGVMLLLNAKCTPWNWIGAHNQLAVK